MEVAPLQSVTNYHFLDAYLQPVSFHVLPLLFEGDPCPSTSMRLVFLHAGGGQLKVFRQVMGWRLGLLHGQPEISVIAADGNWINLQKPGKTYGERTARTVLVTVQALHLLRRYPMLSETRLWALLHRIFGFVERPCKDDLEGHHGLIREFVKRDRRLAGCALIPLLLEERRRKRISSEEDRYEQVSEETFISHKDEAEDVRDEDSDNSKEEPDFFDPVFAIHDNGGDQICSGGRCLRSFHATKSAGKDSNCKFQGYKTFEVEAIQSRCYQKMTKSRKTSIWITRPELWIVRYLDQMFHRSRMKKGPKMLERTEVRKRRARLILQAAVLHRRTLDLRRLHT